MNRTRGGGGGGGGGGSFTQVAFEAWEAKMERLTMVSSELEGKADLEPRARKILAGARDSFC